LRKELILKILLIAPQPFYQDRGTPIAVRLLAQTLGELGHDVHLLVFHEGIEITIPNVTIHRNIALPGISNIKPGLSLKKLICDFFLFIKCIRLIQTNRFDLIHAVEEAVFMAVIVKKIFRIPYIYDMDSYMSLQLIDKFPSLHLIRRFMEWLEQKAVNNSSGVLAVCQALEDIARKFSPDKLVARLEDITLLATNGEGNDLLRERLGITGIIAMYVGNLEKYQGIDLLIESFTEALTKNEDLNLVIIGGNNDDILFYQQRAEQLGIQKSIFFCGQRPVDQLGYYLSQADILVSPRIQGNNTPMKIYSYLDSGKPVLATRLPTHTQVLDETIAYLVNPTTREMAAGFIELAENGTLRTDLGLNARKRVQDEYSLPAFQRKLAAFYKKLPIR
jgi:glycosyltransferase involved in cell wall biosynthesis